MTKEQIKERLELVLGWLNRDYELEREISVSNELEWHPLNRDLHAEWLITIEQIWEVQP